MADSTDAPLSAGRANQGDDAGTGQMDEDELKSILASEIYFALGADGGVLSRERRKLLEYYEGALLGNEVEGRSTVVARNVFEAVEWVLPQVIDVFVSSDKVGEFHPFRPQEEQMAQAATDYINHIVTEENPFFMILYTWIKDALIQKNGYIQCSFREESTHTHDSYTKLTEEQYQQVLSGDVSLEKYPDLDKVEILEESEYPNTDAFTAHIFPKLYDCKVRVHEKIGKIVIENIAPEEILVSRRAPDCVLDGKHFVCRRSLKRVTDLREMGLDEDLIEKAMGYDEQEFNSERISRYVQDDDWPLMGNRNDPAMRQVWLEESYLAVDFDGDGIAELRRIVSAGNGTVIFENEEADDTPFLSLTPIPMAHKHIGMSLAETVVDLQEIKSTLWRQTLDNLYLSNMPRVIVDEMAATDETWDDLMNPEVGAPIRVASIDGIKTFEIPFTAGVTGPILDQIDHIQEVRTGVANQNMTLSPDDLNKYASGTAINLAQEAGSRRIEMFARVFAETGVKLLFKKVLGLVTRHQQQARQVKIAGQWLSFDPSQWREQMDVSVSVGLGTGNKQRQVQQLMALLPLQQNIVKGAAGTPYAALVTPQNAYDVLKKLTEAMGYREEFFSNPAQQQQQQPQQQQPHPEMIKAQAQAQESMARARLYQAQTQKVMMDAQQGFNQAQAENARTQVEAQRMQMESQEVRARIENLRSQAVANLAKAGATQTGAQTDQYLAILEMLDNLVGWHQTDQQNSMQQQQNAQQQMQQQLTPPIESGPQLNS